MMSDLRMEGQYAGFVSRLFAWLIDQGITIAIVAITSWLVYYLATVVGLDLTQCSTTPGWQGFVCNGVLGFMTIFVITFTPLYLMLFWTLGGISPGKAAMGLRIVRMDGEAMNFHTSFRRWLGYFMSFFALGAGFFLILIDNKRQGWDDKFANTCVVYTWRARQNEKLITRLTKKLFRGQKRIDHYSEELRGKSIYGTDNLGEIASETDSTSDASGGDDALTKPEEASKPQATASTADSTSSSGSSDDTVTKPGKDSKQDAGASTVEKTATKV